MSGLARRMRFSTLNGFSFESTLYAHRKLIRSLVSVPSTGLVLNQLLMSKKFQEMRHKFQYPQRV